MTSRDRLTLTLQGRKADRIPVSPFLWYNNMFEMFGYTPEIDTNYCPPDFDIVSKWVEYCDFFGFDVMRGQTFEHHQRRSNVGIAARALSQT